MTGGLEWKLALADADHRELGLGKGWCATETMEHGAHFHGRVYVPRYSLSNVFRELAGPVATWPQLDGPTRILTRLHQSRAIVGWSPAFQSVLELRQKWEAQRERDAKIRREVFDLLDAAIPEDADETHPVAVIYQLLAAKWANEADGGGNDR